MLTKFLEEWFDAGMPVLPLPLPPMVTMPSHRLLRGLEPMADPILQQLTARHDVLVERRAAYVQANGSGRWLLAPTQPSHSQLFEPLI